MSFQNAMIVEQAAGYEVSDEIDYYAAMQRQINDGEWSLQGSHGRAMMRAIEEGYCLCGKNPARDYWGNRIPSRSEVKAGTKGSRDYVAEQMSEEWADYMEAL